MNYVYERVKAAWINGTFWERSVRLFKTIISRTFVVITGYMCLSKEDRSLNVKDGFNDHRIRKDHCRTNPEHLRRIIAAYKASKQAQRQASLPFQIKGVWAEVISVYYKDLVNALNTEDISSLSDMFENLYREKSLCTGTLNKDYFRYHSFLGSLYIKYVWSVCRDKLLTLDFDLQKIESPLIGNPVGVVLNGKVIPIETLKYAYHATEVCELLRDVPQGIIVEIGGGLGMQAYQTMQVSGGRVSKYLLFDIPEVNAISSYYLLSAFPDKRIRLFGEGPVSVASNEEYDIAVFPHFAITQLPNSSVDLFYNSCSFSEMDETSSKKYLSVIEHSCRKYFMHHNHDNVFKFRNCDGSVSMNIIGSKLIPNPASFKRIFKKPRVYGFCRPEDRYYVHFEYLYEKIQKEHQIL